MFLSKLGNGKCRIVSRVSRALLDKRLGQGISLGRVSCEQWYRKPDKWFALTSYNNPYQTIHSELVLLRENSCRLPELIGEKTLVFYGVGTADTESFIAESMLQKNNHCEAIAIDVSSTYLERFFQMLSSLLLQGNAREIFCLGFNDLFENISPEDLVLENSAFSKKCHVCLGNTAGNFGQGEIFGIFKRLSKRGDTLVLGVHLASDMQRILMAYETPLMNDLLLASVKRHFPGKKPQDISWKINGCAIEAWLGSTRLLKSEKYTVAGIRALGEKHGFRFLRQFNDGNSAIVAMERT